MQHYETIIFGNYGNNTIALIQWAHENKLDNVIVIDVETNWAAQWWSERVAAGKNLAKQYGFAATTLMAKPNFSEAVLDRGNFPSVKFQWCSGFLKGLPFLAWGDEMDPACEATLLIGSRRADSRARQQLAEFITESEHFGGRKVWHPLYQHSDQQQRELIERARFDVLPHRSLECDPCIHSQLSDFQHLCAATVARTERLEQQVAKPMFDPNSFSGKTGIREIVEWAKQQTTSSDKASQIELFDMGCGSFYGCGE